MIWENTSVRTLLPHVHQSSRRSSLGLEPPCNTWIQSVRYQKGVHPEIIDKLLLTSAQICFRSYRMDWQTSPLTWLQAKKSIQSSWRTLAPLWLVFFFFFFSNSMSDGLLHSKFHIECTLMTCVTHRISDFQVSNVKLFSSWVCFTSNGDKKMWRVKNMDYSSA